MQYQSPNPMIMIDNLNEDEKHSLRIKGAASQAMQQD
jgi:plasmid stability protein